MPQHMACGKRLGGAQGRMLSYQHAYHAGHAADVAKHAVLTAVLGHFITKPTPLTYYDTHAGRGLYPLNIPEAQKTQEYATGLVPLLNHNIAAPLAAPYLKLLHTINPGGSPQTYPGSPAVAHALLRPGDSLVLAEAHPGERAHLAAWAKPHANIKVIAGDGHTAIPPLLPPTSKRAVVLIDPAYETKTEYAQVSETVQTMLTRWPQACVLVWYPLLPAGLHLPLLRGLKALNVASTWHTVWEWPAATGMYGSSVVVLNLPYGLAAPLAAALTELARAMQVGTPAGPAVSTCQFLHPPR
jgi:23S rRNA (adenine2030-N6)-methyltransferase